MGGDLLGDCASDASEEAPESVARAVDLRIERADLPGSRRRRQRAGRCDFHTECPFDLLRGVTLRVARSPMTDGWRPARFCVLLRGGLLDDLAPAARARARHMRLAPLLVLGTIARLNRPNPRRKDLR